MTGTMWRFQVWEIGSEFGPYPVPLPDRDEVVSSSFLRGYFNQLRRDVEIAEKGGVSAWNGYSPNLRVIATPLRGRTAQQLDPRIAEYRGIVDRFRASIPAPRTRAETYDRIAELMLEPSPNHDPDPCPNCHDSECEGCISGYGASAAVLNAFERLERWRERRGL